MSEAKVWECEDSFGNVHVEQPENLAATTWEGYSIIEKYIDAKEARVRTLERQLSQCQ